MKLTPSSATWLLVALAIGLAIGIAAADTTAAPELIRFLQPVGTAWVNMIRMTVVPLVVATVAASLLAPGSARAAGRLGGRALILTLVLVIAASAVAIALAPPLFAQLSAGADAGSLRAAAQPPAAAGSASFGAWLIELIPANPVKAAADGAMLPLLVFVVLFALAAARVASEHRELLRRGAEAVAAATFVLVRWVLALAPIGVFALAVVLGARLGGGAAAAVLAYVGVVVVLCALVAAALYAVVLLASRMRLAPFARAAAPAQAVALSARSSIAALPAMIDGATRLGIAPAVRNFFLPIAASVYRMGTAVWMPVAVLFLARIYSVPIGPAELLTVLLIAPLLTYSVPSVPAGSLLITAPLLDAVGIPLEGVGILLAADTIPDMVRTALNVTGHMTVAAILNERAPTLAEPGAVAEPAAGA